MLKITCSRICTILLLVATVLAMVVSDAHSTYADQGSRYVYHAYMRRVHPTDPGTIHLFVKNPTTQPLTLSRLQVNGCDIKSIPNGLAIWYQLVPHTIAPFAVGDMMIKLRWSTSKPVRVSGSLSNGDDVSVVISPDPPVARISFIGFDQGGHRAYVYVENAGPKDLCISRVCLGSADITEDCDLPDRGYIRALSKGVIIYSPKAPFQQGSHATFRVSMKTGVVAAAQTRVYAHFPIAVYGKDRRKEIGLDPESFELKYPADDSAESLRKLASQPLFKAIHLFNDPACKDKETSALLGSCSAEIIRRAGRCYENDPHHPTFIYSCVYLRPSNYFVYGEMADVFVVAPYEMYYAMQQPLVNAHYTSLAKRACAPRLLWTIPEAFNDKRPRLPTPEEERIIVYSEIGEGGKGVWYFTDKPGCGYRSSPPLEAEMGRINRELQVLRQYILIGETFPLVETCPDIVKAYSLLCGDQAVVLLLLNGDHKSSFDGSRQPFTYTPKRKFQVMFRVPDWLTVTGVYEVSDGERRPLAHSMTDNRIILSVSQLDISKQVLVLTERRR